MNLPLTKEEKRLKERSVKEITYKTKKNWKVIKQLKSDTPVRAWHLRVEGNDYRLIQVAQGRLSERLAVYNATKTGMIEDSEYGHAIFDKGGDDWLHGIEYLLRYLDGEDITKLRL